ncbi:phosphotransferase family protein [Rhodococcus sp. CC-R104]|uniref:Phosphotransferase family protein n=1 Tax=Rhodococcus chondri TaxID=3065941 RepID=A0ABU7JY28_9NOCA|nr:phosphotransferase family protein [Rhodococcus sp. CC-R104]
MNPDAGAVTAQALAEVLAGQGSTAVSVTELRRLTGGASRQIFSFDAVRGDGTRSAYVLRRDPSGHGDAPRMRAEAACLRAARAAGVPVPRVVSAADTAPGLDSPFLIMERLPGESIPRRILRDESLAAARARLAHDLGAIAARIHAVPVSEVPMLADDDPLDAISGIYRDFHEPRPVVEIALRWLAAHRPETHRKVLVHGDFRLGNLLVGTGGVEGVLDWELAHRGDPIEDLGWLCVRAWRFGGTAPVAGVGTREELLDGYEREAHWRPDLNDLHWWEVFGTLRWLVLGRFQAQRHLRGDERSAEFAAIGRRVCESEWDLLRILGMIGHGDALPPEPRPEPHHRGDLHGLPDVPGLLDAAIAELGDGIAPAVDDPGAAYRLKICVNLLRIAQRELVVGSAQRAAHAGRLTRIGCRDEAELALRIRTGQLDPADPNVRSAVAGAVAERLRVTNPRHLVSRE